MLRWDRRLRIVLDWTFALFFRPDITRVELRVEREQLAHARSATAPPTTEKVADNSASAARRVTLVGDAAAAVSPRSAP